MYYLTNSPNNSGNYGNPMGQPFNNCIQLPEELLNTYLDSNGFVTLTIENNIITNIEQNTEAYNAWKESLPLEADPLISAKEERVAQSKSDLETYLLENPLQWTDGQYYAITAEKQNQLTSKLMAATVAQQMSTEYHLTWNSTGDVCTEWNLSDLYALAFAIDKRVTGLVTYQQTKEIEINNANSIDELDTIIVDYNSVTFT